MDTRPIIRTLAWTLVASSLLMAFKFFAFVMTGSNSILSDALESIVNVVAGGLALYSIWYSTQPRDKEHPYGHGKIEFISSGVEGALIIFAGAIIIYKSILDLQGEHMVEELGTGTAIVAGGAVVNLAIGLILIRQGKKMNSVVLEANGKHILSDSISTWGILLGLVIILYTDLIWLDNVFAIIFGAVIIFIGLGILRKSYAGVMDEADFSLIEKMVDILNQNRKPEWVDIHNLRAIKFGSKVNVDCHMTLPWYWDVTKSHSEIKEVEKLVNDNLEQEVEFFIHVDPCKPANCPHCQIEDCHERQAEFIEPVSWTIETILPDRKHLKN